jgi:hypothetical protein
MQALRDKLERESVDCGATPPSKLGASAWLSLADNRELSVLAGDSLAGRFRHWRGASGRRYIFSVYDQASCPAYDDAILIVATIDARGERRIVFIADTGVLPELALTQASRMTAALESPVEFHVHLLAVSRAERMATINDLGPAGS